MWKLIETVEDAYQALEILELAEPHLYGTSFVKCEREEKSKRIASERFSWIYEDSGKFIILKFSINNLGIGHIEVCVPYGFSDDLYASCVASLPIAVSKIREIMKEKGSDRAYAVSPKTKLGECMAYIADTFLDVQVSEMPDRMGWKTEILLNSSEEIKEYRKSKIDSDVAREANVSKKL